MTISSADRIVADLRTWMGTVAPGTQLPSSRELAARHSASPVTVQKALHTLAGMGLVEARPGSGTFVRQRPSRPGPPDFGWQTNTLGAPAERIPTLSTPLRDIPTDAVGLHSGYPARELLPERAVRAALVRASRGEAALRRAPAAGLPDLQTWFAAELSETTPHDVTAAAARDVIVVPGSQSGVCAVLRSLVGPGRPVVMESPTYWGAMAAAAQAGSTIVPIPSRPEGPDPDDLSRALDSSGATVFYAQPNFANPTGALWSADARDRVLAVLRKRGAFMIEDDWAHDFGIDVPAIPLASADDTGTIIYVRSLTKSVSPALRVAAIIARGPVRERIAGYHGADAMYVSPILQAATLDVVLSPAWRTHRRHLTEALRIRRDLLMDCLHDHVPELTVDRPPRGGLNIWARLPYQVDAGALVRECERHAVVIAAGDEWFPSEPSGPFVRLNFAAPDPARLPDATRVIGTALRGLLNQSPQ
ncbi:aminotransferase-like domain-containing protein [Gordonia pseudamarae]|uniref:Aminotransferase class I/II-fold pyridoxal phosphate-dependent enzyme n=1 Tax=Gordonia pseudamarae TaxID=2831662 RepID=A0ABX6II37_9ACTN|nr:PLP-dependent aminotransferase family protein [Gordonia pseudamarae]QHN35539.1 aminotransferase class I/II-fold pyridoxal phosphate-dependent enzyme [Gordonia pseudamarae]